MQGSEVNNPQSHTRLTSGLKPTLATFLNFNQRLTKLPCGKSLQNCRLTRIIPTNYQREFIFERYGGTGIALKAMKIHFLNKHLHTETINVN